MRIILAVLLVVLAGSLGVVYTQWQKIETQAEAYGVPFTLIDGQGNEITEQAFRGQPSALFFGFTHCPEICPTTLFEMDNWLNALGEEGENIDAFFVTIDPERDTPEFLNEYVTSISERVVAISGNPEEVFEMASGYGVYYKRIELEDGDYTMDHTASVFLLDSNGAFRSTIAWGEDPDTAIEKLRNLSKL